MKMQCNTINKQSPNVEWNARKHDTIARNVMEFFTFCTLWNRREAGSVYRFCASHDHFTTAIKCTDDHDDTEDDVEICEHSQIQTKDMINVTINVCLRLRLVFTIFFFLWISQLSAIRVQVDVHFTMKCFLRRTAKQSISFFIFFYCYLI